MLLFSININVSGKFFTKLLTMFPVPEFTSLIDAFLLVSVYRIKWKLYKSALYSKPIFHLFHLIGKYIDSSYCQQRLSIHKVQGLVLCLRVPSTQLQWGIYQGLPLSKLIMQVKRILNSEKIITWTCITRVSKLFCWGPGSKYANMSLWTIWLNPNYSALL